MDRRVILGVAAAIVAAIVIGAIVLNAGSIFGGGDEPIVIMFDAQMAQMDVEALIANGPRMTGTVQEEMGARYIASQFEEAGLEGVAIETYWHVLFEVNSAQVSLIEYGPLMRVPRIGGEHKDLNHKEDFVLQGFSGSRSWVGFRDDLEIVPVGDGNDAGAFASASGRACLIEQTEKSPSNTDLFFTAYESGARALVLQNSFQGEEVGFLPFYKSTRAPEPGETYPDIPFFMVSRDLGDEMTSKASTHKLRLDIDVTIEERPVLVVTGDIKGSKDPDRMIVLGAHHDTCYNTVGVVDNTVGAAAVVGMARSLAKYNPERTIRFLTFGGEEEGLYGSILYYDAHRAELEKGVELYMNFDMPHADKEALRITITTTSNSSIQHLNDFRKALLDREPDLKEYTINIVYEDMKWAGSDHWPFVEDGHQAMGGWGSGCAEYHTYLDNVEHLNPESLKVCGSIMGSYALDAAM